MALGFAVPSATPLPQRATRLDDFLAAPVGRYVVAGTTLTWVVSESVALAVVMGRPGRDEARAALAAFDVLDSPALRGPTKVLLDARRLAIDVGGLEALVGWVRARRDWLGRRVALQVGLVRYGPVALTLCGILPYLGSPYPFTITESPSDAAAQLGVASDVLAIAETLADVHERAPSTIERLRLLLDERRLSLPVDLAARALGLSTRTLQRALAQAGTSYGAEVRRARFELARRLLADGDDKVAVVAQRVGISESSLTELTRAHAGCTPAALRRQRALAACEVEPR